MTTKGKHCAKWLKIISISGSQNLECTATIYKQGKSEGFDSCDRPYSNWIQILHFSAPMTLKFDGWPQNGNRAPLLYYIKPCASLEIHQLIQTGVTVWKRWIQVEISNFLSCTLKFNGWPRKTIGHLFYTTLSFVHHFKSISEFKLGSKSGNDPFSSKFAIF